MLWACKTLIFFEMEVTEFLTLGVGANSITESVLPTVDINSKSKKKNYALSLPRFVLQAHV